MTRILHIHASPRPDSYSLQLADAFLQTYRKKYPDCDVDTLDLFHEPIPEFDAPAAKAKYAVLAGEQPEDHAASVWKQVIDVVRRFSWAKLYVFSCPMWNFAIPYRLKHYFDVIVQPGLTFSFSPEKGYEGLITGRPAVLLMARGGEYAPGTASAAYNKQQPYLEGILRFIGFSDIRSVSVERTLEDPINLPQRLKQAQQEASTLAQSL